MVPLPQPPSAVYAAAAETLADIVVRAIRGADDAFRLSEVLTAGDPATGLAAVRVLGPDALAPYLIIGYPFATEDAEVVTTSLAAFPLDSDGEAPVRRFRDWATRALLARLTDQPAPVLPETPACGPKAHWLVFVGELSGLAPLVAPGLDSPIHTAARTRALDVARGVSRSMLRRDYLTAVRLSRWLATGPCVPGVELGGVLTHVELFGDDSPRLRLEVVLARATAQWVDQ